MAYKLQPLVIGDLEIKIPIIQGGMGVKVSTSSLASAVANCGGAGVIASVALGYGTEENQLNYVRVSNEGLRDELRMARERTTGAIGVNILFALTNYEELAKTAAQEGADFIVAGAGLPLNLPEITKGYPIKLIPIVSSSRAVELICKTWKRRYNRLPDAVVVEGPLAGGHLGFKAEELKPPKEHMLEEIVVEVMNAVNTYGKEAGVNIPVIAAGGIFDGKDAVRFFKLGVQGVQMATRFVATHECSVADEFKQLYISAKESDVVIIDSPVGMPGKSLKTKFVDRIMNGARIPFSCHYKCLRTCDPKTAPYCIAKALVNAVKGDIDNAVVFCGSNVHKIEKIVHVKELMDTIVQEMSDALHEDVLAAR
ncbi:MAG: nitronate monooxygenase family protein [bacterium]